MSTRHRATRLIQRSAMLQLGIVAAFWLAGEAAVRVLGLPVPGGIVGLALLLMLLVTRRLSAASMRRGADWLLADMLLFFVPAVLAVLDHREFLGIVGLKILFVITVSTAVVMLVTAFAVERCYRWRIDHAPVGPHSR
ncbi:MAG: CidA/LrgA family protein [Afipia sp.]|nr:CidA/LrgA family protein [Afipia sp.]